MKNFLSLTSVTPQTITELLDYADRLKYESKHSISHKVLDGKALGMIFQKASTRTRISFEMGMYQLGGTALFLSSNDMQLNRGESISDTARVLSRYLDGIMIRAYYHSDVEELAKNSEVPVINGLTDFCHPCQVLADLMTVREYRGALEGLKLCYIGDGNNMANSLIVGGLKTGMSVSVACPEGYEPSPRVLTFAKSYEGDFSLVRDPLEAAANADVIFTDVWTSMGQESEKAARKAAFCDIYQVNDAVMAAANEGCMVQHCLPAHKGEEITEKVFEAHAKEIFDEAENRLHAQKAVMATLMI
ncbi:MAG: ornithine carbamoyltransferase [Clostridiales bacterium]|nr:ornithine carbamoyltransferase [Clostridiales bacterium]